MSLDLSASEILKVKTKGTINIVEGSDLHKAVISAMLYYARQEIIKKKDYGQQLFTLSTIRQLNIMVKKGEITVSRMVEIMNEAVKWEDVDLGHKYLCDMISDLKNDQSAPIK